MFGLSNQEDNQEGRARTAAAIWKNNLGGKAKYKRMRESIRREERAQPAAKGEGHAPIASSAKPKGRQKRKWSNFRKEKR